MNPRHSYKNLLSAAVGLFSLGFILGHSTTRPHPRPTAVKAAVALPSPSATRNNDNFPQAANVLSDATSIRALPDGQQPNTPLSEQALCAQLQQLALTDSHRALDLAASAATPRQRELFRNAALQGWASSDSMAAANWTLSHVRSEDRRTAVESIATGAVNQPQKAVAAFYYLVNNDPLQASDHGNSLVNAFARAGQYEDASQFASAGSAEFRAAWLCTVYNQWATYQPQAALASLEKLNDPAARNEARISLFAGWSMSDPAALVAYGQTLPTGDVRLQALNEGLAQWVHRDPPAASVWMDKFDPSPDLDAGAAAVAVSPALVAKKPDVAASWAESITDPELRANTLLDLIRIWAEHDATAARNYAATSPALRPETRELALASLQPSP